MKSKHNNTIAKTKIFMCASALAFSACARGPSIPGFDTLDVPDLLSMRPKPDLAQPMINPDLSNPRCIWSKSVLGVGDFRNLGNGYDIKINSIDLKKYSSDVDYSADIELFNGGNSLGKPILTDPIPRIGYKMQDGTLIDLKISDFKIDPNDTRINKFTLGYCVIKYDNECGQRPGNDLNVIGPISVSFPVAFRESVYTYNGYYLETNPEDLKLLGPNNYMLSLGKSGTKEIPIGDSNFLTININPRPTLLAEVSCTVKN